MARIVVKVAHVKAKVAVNRVPVEQAVLAERRAQVAANQRVHLSQPVRAVAQCHRARNIVPVGVGVNSLPPQAGEGQGMRDGEY